MSANSVVIDGVKYVREQANGNRAVVVVDRGWIFAGDVTDENGRIKISRALWLFRWEKIGLNGVIESPKAEGVDLRKIDDVDIPAGAEVFRIAVSDDWGL